jgi:hypothetical protein
MKSEIASASPRNDIKKSLSLGVSNREEVAMQLDMHFYGVYALARAAGVKPETARMIAHTSQFVDDAIEDEAIEVEGRKAVVPTMTSHKPIDYQNAIPGDQWKVWVPFHFLPGNGANAKTFIEKMVCQKNSSPAKQMLDHALQHKEELFGPHLVGITAHVYADTFSHYGFVGLSRDFNKVEKDSIDIHPEKNSIRRYLLNKFETFKTRVAGSLAEAVPVGHGAVGTFPDRPYLHWEYKYERGGHRERENIEDFTEACECLHSFFVDFVSDNAAHGDPVRPVPWGSITEKVRDILKQEGPVDERIKRWRDAISSNDLFRATDADKAIAYSEKAWRSARIVYDFAEGKTADECDACLFIRAAWKHRNYVLQNLLPSMEVVAY